jgi:ribosome-binding protein aMBF1 (putative translation factor)
MITKGKTLELNDTTLSPEFTDYLLKRAEILVDNDTSYVESLVALRKANGLSTLEVANRTNVLEEIIIDFESYHSDPKLSLLRRYAHAVNAIVKHSVIMDPDGPNYSSVVKESNDKE